MSRKQVPGLLRIFYVGEGRSPVFRGNEGRRGRTPVQHQLLLSLLSAADTTLYEVATELAGRHERETPDDVLDGLAVAIVEQSRGLRKLLRMYAEIETAQHRQRRR